MHRIRPNTPRVGGKFAKPKPATNVIELLDLLGLSDPTWDAWRSILRFAFELPLEEGDLDLVRDVTGREKPPSDLRELWLILGRRAGKSRIAAALVIWLAICEDYSLAPGETGMVLVLSSSKQQAGVIKKYVSAFLEHERLAGFVTRSTRSEIVLEVRGNEILVAIQSANFRNTRGYTLVGAICDEIAFWFSDETSANPDVEILAALRPGMATTRNSKLIIITSPYARRGETWRAFKDFHGREDEHVLVVNAPSKKTNPTIPSSVIERAKERDPARAAAEWEAVFRSDIETFVSIEVVEDATVSGRHELPYDRARDYVAFVDPSGGSSDSFTLAIAHLEPRKEEKVVVLDLLRERTAPFSPEKVVAEFADVLRSYSLGRVKGDRYGGEFPRELFRKRGIYYEPSTKVKSEIYLELLPLLNAGRIELLDDKLLRSQLVGLERRTSRGGKSSVDHAPRAKDDVANAAAGAIVLAQGSIFGRAPRRRRIGWG